MQYDASEIPLAAVTGGLAAGGSSTFLVNLTRALRLKGERTLVVSLSEHNAYRDDFPTDGGRVLTIDERCNIYEDVLSIAYAELARWRPQAVLACLGANSFDVLRLVPAGVARLGIIQSDHSEVYEVVRMFSVWLDCVIGVSTEICNRVREMPEIAGKRVELVPYGICFRPQRQRHSPGPEEALRLVYVGRLIEEQKRVSRLIGLVSELARRKVNFQFTIAGGGPEAVSLRRSLAPHANVIFKGELSPDEVQELLQNQDVFILLSDYEGLPLSLIEAMGSGVVPVISDLESGVRDVVSEDCGFRVPVGDIGAAADAVERLARDRVRLTSLSRAAESVRSQYSAARMADRYLALIEEMRGTNVRWPGSVIIPKPFHGGPPQRYCGVPRILRRWAKRFIAGRRGRSNQS